MLDDQAREEKKALRKLREKEKERKLHRDAFVRASIKYPEGRAYFFWLMEIAKIAQNPYTGNALHTAFQCGELNVGQQIQAHLIEVSPGGFLDLLAEREKERLDATRRHDSPDDDSDDGTASGDNGTAYSG